MKNLIGNLFADNSIIKELNEAGIIILKVPQIPLSTPEVTYSRIGKLAEWTFIRKHGYWQATASKGLGLSLDIAQKLSEKEYPHSNIVDKYGQVIRVKGLDNGKLPDEHQMIFSSIGYLIKSPPDETEQQIFYALLDKFSVFQTIWLTSEIPEDARLVIPSYHIDTQDGLNEFARVIRGEI